MTASFKSGDGEAELHCSAPLCCRVQCPGCCPSLLGAYWGIIPIAEVDGGGGGAGEFERETNVDFWHTSAVALLTPKDAVVAAAVDKIQAVN